MPQSDDSDLGDAMEDGGGGGSSGKNADLIRLAENALPLAEKHGLSDESLRGAPKADHLRPELPRILTQSRAANVQEKAGSKTESLLSTSRPLSDHGHEDRKTSRAASDSLSTLKKDGSQHRPTKSLSKSPDRTNDSEEDSPVMRRNTIPTPVGASTLPPMQNQKSPPSSSSKLSNGQESLPSLSSMQLKPLMDSRPPNESCRLGVNRSAVPLKSPSAQSPPLVPAASRPSPSYPSPQTRLNGFFNSTFPNGQPSPAYSDSSLRDSSNMSPPDKPGTAQYVQYQLHKGSTHSDELTPQSAESYPSSATFSTAPSPHLESMEVDRSGRLLPPLVPHSGPALMTGAFKCDYAGCKAAPFQTQYLLKYVRSWLEHGAAQG